MPMTPARLGRSPFTRILPPAMACAAWERVLYQRAAQSQRSSRTASPARSPEFARARPCAPMTVQRPLLRDQTVEVSANLRSGQPAPADHDARVPPDVDDVFQRVGVQQEEIGLFPDLDGPGAILGCEEHRH